MAWYGEYLRACKMLECSYGTYMLILNDQRYSGDVLEAHYSIWETPRLRNDRESDEPQGDSPSSDNTDANGETCRATMKTDDPLAKQPARSETMNSPRISELRLQLDKEPSKFEHAYSTGLDADGTLDLPEYP
jgi:hypothetical protein